MGAYLKLRASEIPVPLGSNGLFDPHPLNRVKGLAGIRLPHVLRRQQANRIFGQDFIDARVYEREIDALVCRIDGFLEALSCVGAIGLMVAVMYHRAACAARRPLNVEGPSGGTSKAYNQWRRTGSDCTSIAR